MHIEVGAYAETGHVVQDSDTAAAVGSGDLPVLGTPVLLSWLEQATVAACGSDAEHTTVGTRVEIEHLRPSPVGMSVTASAEVTGVDRRNITLAVAAVFHGDGEPEVLARGVIRRTVVLREKFLRKLG